MIAPVAADAYEGRLLEAEEARAARKVVLETWTDHQRITHGKFRVPQIHGAMLKKALDAIMSPARTTMAEQAEHDNRPLVVKRARRSASSSNDFAPTPFPPLAAWIRPHSLPRRQGPIPPAEVRRAVS